MKGVWFERVELRYGRHRSGFDLVPAGEPGPEGGGNGTSGPATPRGRPLVIAGPNGAGKSTLLEAPLRGLFGFYRRRNEEKAALDARRPWAGGAYRVRLLLRGPAGRFAVDRNLETDAVRIERHGESTPVFEDEVGGGSAGERGRQFAAVLAEIVGLTDLVDYRRTAWVGQGELQTGDLNLDLLRIAAGGHSDVESALDRIEKEYRELTIEPLVDGRRRRRTAGRRERLADEIEELEVRLLEARAIDERRAPYVRDREECLARLSELEEQTAVLERAFEMFSEAHRLELEKDQSQARVDALEGATRELDESLARLHLLEDRGGDDGLAYPEDFLERIRALEEGLWPRQAQLGRDLDDLERSIARADAAPPYRTWVGRALGGGLVLAGIASMVLNHVVPGFGLVAAGILTLGGVERIARADRRRRVGMRRRREALVEEARDLAGRIARLLEDVPDAASLTPETLPPRRREFERWLGDRRAVQEADEALRRALDVASKVLEGREAETPAKAGGVRARARDLLDRLHAAAATERNERLAPLKLRLREMARARFDLPIGVEPTLEGVRVERRERLDEMKRLRGQLREAERALATEARVDESVSSLARELAERRGELGALDRRIAAYRHAYRLVSEAYDAFRKNDEQRLLASISRHLQMLSGGALGPLEAGEGLERVRVASEGRWLPLDTPPLSYGQRHAVLLAVRLGAADFLAQLGVRVPLLIDDPFVHLDEARARDVWSALERIAVERQVIVATQDRLVLDHLGVVPDIDLMPGPQGRVPEMAVDPGAAAPPVEIAVERTPDLWDQAEG